MPAMESKTRATVGYSLAASLRVRRPVPAIEAALTQDSRGAAQIDNETLISRGRSTTVTRISGGGAVPRIIGGFGTVRRREIQISNSAEVSLCASA
jgi:hypothetical protein